MGRETLVEVIDRVSLGLMSHYEDRRESVILCKNAFLVASSALDDRREKRRVKSKNDGERRGEDKGLE